MYDNDRLFPDPADPGPPRALAAEVSARVLRTDLSAPGFALLDLGTALTPRDFRAWLARLGDALDAHHREHFGGELRFVSVSRFDQQAPTRPHRDGGPDSSVLLLGYEPSEVPSRVYLLDYTRCALDLGLTPREFLLRHNPAFAATQDLLRDYTAEARGFTPARYQVLVVNNSCLPYSERARGMLGVLHHAVVTPLPGRPRFVDSMLLAAEGPGVEVLTDGEVRQFVETAAAAAR